MSTEIIVLEPTGKQKNYTLKPHGDLDKVQKRWKSHLKNIGASWSDKKKQWSLSLDRLKDFEKIQSIMTTPVKEEKKEEVKSPVEEKKETKTKKRKREKSSRSESESSDSDDESSSDSSSDSDEEVIEFLKNKIKNIIKPTHEKILADDVDNSDEEDVIRLTRRIRYILLKMQKIEKRVNDLEEENAFLHKQMASLK